MIFLVIVLVSAIVLFALVSQNPRGKQRRGGRGGGYRGGSGHHQPAPSLTRDQIATRWVTIQGMAAQGGGNGLRNAIMEADKLLDHYMRSSGAAGDTMADRLRSSQNRLSDRNSVWRAHKLRNALAHEVGFDLVASQAREALADFERALKDLGGL
ncbi:MAG: hypothetical protein JWN01_725 [Patescibacteria group bacterium]|nr:hypothetical protein [Patescibacteria group bacterium]